MALTKVSRGLLSTGIVDNSNATAITINADESVTLSSTLAVTSGVTSGAHLINASSSAFGSNSVQGFNTDFLVDSGQGFSRHNSYHTGGSNHQFLVNEASSTTNAVAFSIAKDKSATFSGSVDAGAGLRFSTDGSNNGVITTLGQNKGLYFAGDDAGVGINALVLDMSAAGFASFNNGITLKNELYINNADGSATAGYLYNESNNFVIRSFTQDKDIIFKGNDGGSLITALTLDMSAAGTAVFNSSVTSSKPQGGTAFYASTAGSYFQGNGSSSNAMAFGMTGGNASPATAASTSFGFHHWNNSAWANPVNITRDGIAFNGDTAQANALSGYETGTWTIGLENSSGASTTPNNSTKSGRYVKVGNLVHVAGYYINTSLNGVTGHLRLKGLPFTAAANDVSYSTLDFAYGVGFNLTAGTNPTAYVTKGTRYCWLNQWNATTGTNLLSNAHVTDSVSFIFKGTYYTDE